MDSARKDSSKTITIIILIHLSISRQQISLFCFERLFFLLIRLVSIPQRNNSIFGEGVIFGANMFQTSRIVCLIVRIRLIIQNIFHDANVTFFKAGDMVLPILASFSFNRCSLRKYQKQCPIK